MRFLRNLFGGRKQPPIEEPAPGEPRGSIVSPTGKTPALRIEVDRLCCTGQAECLRIAPGVFQLDGENIAVVVDAAAADRETLIAAAEACPTQAIRLYELDGEQVYPDWM